MGRRTVRRWAVGRTRWRWTVRGVGVWWRPRGLAPEAEVLEGAIEQRAARGAQGTRVPALEVGGVVEPALGALGVAQHQ